MKIISRDAAIKIGCHRYFTGRPCKRGHFKERLVTSRTCVECARLASVERRKIETREQKEANNKTSKRSYLRNAKHIRKKAMDKYYKNRSEILANRKLRSPDQVERGRKIRREWMRKWESENKMQSFCRKALRRMCGKSFTGKTDRYEEIVGYTRQQFMDRLEFQFKDGMNWGNHGKWEIDHKKPMSRFIKQGIKDPKLINALSNLQPLWAEDNRIKRDKF